MRDRRRPAKPTAKKRPAPPPHPKPRRRRRLRRFRLAAYLSRTEELAHLGRDSTRIAIGLALLVMAFMLANACLKTWQETREKTPPTLGAVLPSAAVPK
jgi:hypothetical protein